MLVQFAQMGWALATERFGMADPRVGLLSIGEEATKGNALVKEAHALLEAGAAGPDVRFIGNVEGRDVMTDRVDVVVTDGFTGNVVLKTLEGGVKTVVEAVLGALTSSDEVKEAAKAVMPALGPLASELDPDTYGGAVLLGVDGVCVISHGSSGQKSDTQRSEGGSPRRGGQAGGPDRSGDCVGRRLRRPLRSTCAG